MGNKRAQMAHNGLKWEQNGLKWTQMTSGSHLKAVGAGGVEVGGLVVGEGAAVAAVAAVGASVAASVAAVGAVAVPGLGGDGRNQGEEGNLRE